MTFRRRVRRTYLFEPLELLELFEALVLDLAAEEPRFLYLAFELLEADDRLEPFDDDPDECPPLANAGVERQRPRMIAAETNSVRFIKITFSKFCSGRVKSRTIITRLSDKIISFREMSIG
jgi:hypothetical protein